MGTSKGMTLLVARLAEADLPLVTLTAEEVAAATVPDRDGNRLVPLGRIDEMDERDRWTATAVSQRSLAARKLLDERGTPTSRLALALAIRSRPQMVAIVDRQDGADAAHRYLYGAEDDIVLEEQVDDGTHRFTLSLRRSSATRLVSFVDPRARAPQCDGDPVVRFGAGVESSWADVEATTGPIETVTRLFSTRAGPKEQTTLNLSVVTGADGLAVVGGYAATPGHAEMVRPVVSSRSLSASSLSILFMAFLDPTPAEARPSDRALR